MLRQLIRPLYAKEQCPSCSHRFRLWQTPFRCTSEASLCKPERDDRFAIIWKDQAPRGKVVAPPGPFARRAKCHGCGQQTRKRLCPNCHMELPPTTGELPSYSFAVVGAKEAGKSHYIAVLIDHWRQRLGPAMDIELRPVGDGTRQRYAQVFADPIFKRRTVIDTTRSALGNVDNRLPLIYTLTVSGKNLLGRRVKQKAVNLAFYDSAGEDLNSSDVMSVVNKYIYSAHGIILLLDPLQLPSVRDQLGSAVALPGQNTETVDILERVADLIRNGRDKPSTWMIPIPLAVSFSKLDALEPLIEPHYSVLAEPDHTSGFDEGDAAAVSGEMEALIALWQGEALLDQVRNHFKHYRFFGLSALGCNPQADRRIPRVIPRRVEDPFLWLLRRRRLIQSKPAIRS
jgi:hypothetical protein